MSPLGPVIRAALLIAAWCAWTLAFAVRWKRHREKAVQVDPKARWGIALEAAGYFLVYTHGPQAWRSGLETGRAIAGTPMARRRGTKPGSRVGADRRLAHRAASDLRFHAGPAAGYNLPGRNLARLADRPGGVYRGMGTEIRVRAEDALLRERFGERFIQWRRSVPAYLPFVR